MRGATVALEPVTDDTMVRLSTSPIFFDDWRGKKWRKLRMAKVYLRIR